MKKILSRFSVNSKVLAVLFILIMIIGMSSHQNFFSVRNFMAISQQMSEIGIMAIGMTLVIITRGIDISTGTAMGLFAIVTALCMRAGLPVILTVIISLATAMLCGALNAFMIANIRVPAMIATLGTQLFFNGIALALSRGGTISSIYESYYFLGQGKIADILPVQAFILIVIAVFVHIVLTKRRLGKQIFAIGNNIEAARFSGINTNRVLFIVYISCAVLSCVAGNIQVARVTTARADMGTVYMMQCISAVVLGGTSISGGKGGVGGTIVSVLVFTMVGNIMNLSGVSPHWQTLVTGLIMVAVLVFNRITEGRKRIKAVLDMA